MTKTDIARLSALLDTAAAQLRTMKAPRSVRERLLDAHLSVDWLRREMPDD